MYGSACLQGDTSHRSTEDLPSSPAPWGGGSGASSQQRQCALGLSLWQSGFWRTASYLGSCQGRGLGQHPRTVLPSSPHFRLLDPLLLGKPESESLLVMSDSL